MTTVPPDLPGAVSLPGVLGVAHYGDPLREQRRLAAGESVVFEADRSVVLVEGPDRLSWLDSITSQALTALAPEASTELLVLDPQGRVEHAAAVVDDGAAAWLITDTADADALTTWLSRMVFRSQVRVSRPDQASVVGFVAGGPAETAVRALGDQMRAPIWNDPWTHVTPGGHQYATTTPHPGAGWAWAEAVVTARGLEQLAEAIGAGQVAVAGSLAPEALRIAAWRPRRVTEVDERTLPHELDWLRSAVHLNKGCYRGQETVAKVHNLGHPPRRLVFLHLDGAVPAPGDEVSVGEQVVGTITSAALHFDEGPIALALVRRNVPVDAALSVATSDGPVDAAAEVIVPPEAGAAAGVPRLPRLSSRR